MIYPLKKQPVSQRATGRGDFGCAPLLQSEDAFHFRYGKHEATLNSLPQRHGRNRAGATRADQAKLYDAVIFIEIDELDIAAVAAQRWTNTGEDFLDLVPGGSY
jgi:hypothetical protein